ncbi:MAG: hypothetical protein ABIX12_09250, partial [Rubrivivax sp.]
MSDPFPPPAGKSPRSGSGPIAGRRRRIVLAALSSATFVSFWLTVWPEATWAVPLWVLLAVGGVLWGWPGRHAGTGTALAAPPVGGSAEAALC